MEEDKKEGFLLFIVIVIGGFIFYQSWKIYSLSLSIYQAQNIILKIDSTYIKLLNKQKRELSEDDFIKIEKWLNDRGEVLFKLNKKDISTEFLILKKCWRLSKAIKCSEYYSNIKRAISRYIKKIEKRLKEFFIILTIALSMFMGILYKFNQVYIHRRVQENIIYDNESRLYSYYYCVDIAKKLCSHSDRTRRAIAAIYIQLPQLQKYSLEERKKIIENTGEYLTSTIRLSDIACRYGSSSFLIFMPNISEEEKIPVNRISEGLTKYIREFSPDCEVIVSSVIREFEEDYREFIKRATKS